MPQKRVVIGKPLLLLLLTLLVWWIVPVFIKSFSRNVFFEFQAPAWTAISSLKDLQSYWALRSKSKNELIAAGRDLARLNASYEISNQKARATEAELKRLEKLLDLPASPQYRYEVARVTHRDLNGWWQQLVIRKGSRQGVIKGAAVICAEGVVGRISEVHTYTSVVELISDSNFRMAAHIEGDPRPITYKGGNNIPLRPPLGSVSNVPADITPSKDGYIRVVTSRLGGIFPDGITVGYLKSLNPGSDGLFQTGTLLLPANLVSITEVAVLIPLAEEITDSEAETIALEPNAQ